MLQSQIAIAPSRHRVIASSRHRVIASSRHRVIASSRHRQIAKIAIAAGSHASQRPAGRPLSRGDGATRWVSPRAPGVGRAGAGMIVEVQERVIDLERWRIWLYWALLAEHLRLSTIVMLVPLTDAVSNWARSLGAREFQPRDGFLVLDRQNMPRIIDLEQARQRPAMVVLSALIHGPLGDREVLHVAFEVARELPDDRRWRYMKRNCEE
jgi:hypothetical protein